MTIPNAKVPFLQSDGSLTLPWRNWAQGLSPGTDSTADIAAIEAEVATLVSEVAVAQADAAAALAEAATALGETDAGLLAALIALSQLDGILGASGVTPGAYGDATHVSRITVDAEGIITLASSVAITFPVVSFNTRTGAIVLTAADIVTAFGVTAVSGLPASPTDGQRSFVTDSSVAAAGNFGAIVAGLGTNHVPVYWESGTSNWRIG